MINRKIDVSVTISTEELAREFCGMNQQQQAEFFNIIGYLTSKWDRSFCFQLQAITDDDTLTDSGRRVMREIGGYSSEYFR